MAEALLDRRSREGRFALLTVILGSGIALLDGTIVNIAVRTIGTDLDASLGQLQWVITGYLLSLASLILVGGSLGDRLGRRRVYLWGVAGFGVGSVLCATAQDPGQLIFFRVLQGIAAAALTPGSLAIIRSSFRERDRPAVIGTWAGMTGIGAALGPFVGGLLVQGPGWRWIFLINVPLCALVLWLGRCIPESRDETREGRLDVWGAVLGVVSLGTLTLALTASGSLSGGVVAGLMLACVVSALAFLAVERRPDAMMPLSLFASRVFSAANLMTLLVYGALGGVTFLLVLQLQVTSGFSPLAAGLATLPITVAMVFLSARFAVIAVRIGPRVPMTVGPLACALGVLLLSGVGRGTGFWTGVFPGMAVFALGLSGLVSPLTTAVLAAAPSHNAGVASGINNAVARTGSLLAVAALPAVVGLSGQQYDDPVALTHGYRLGQLLCAVLLAAGGVVSWFGLAGHDAATGAMAGQDGPHD